jgi:fatty-acyl-CoA synthase
MDTKSELYGGSSALTYGLSVFTAIEDGLMKDPNRLAVVSRSQPGDHLAEVVQSLTGPQPSRVKDSCLRWTYAEFLSVTLNLAAGLSAQATGAESLIVTFIPNSVEWLLLLSSTIFAKMGIACLDIDMLQKPRRAELEARLKQLRPSVIIVTDNAGASAVDNVLQNLDLEQTLKISLRLDSPQLSSPTDDWRLFTTLCTPHPASTLAKITEDARHDDPERTAWIIYTSGTSGGLPKGCIRHVASIVAFIKGQRFGKLRAAQHNVNILQTANFRTIAPAIALMSLLDGSTIVMSTHPWHPRTFLQDLEEEKVTTTALIPAQVHAIANEPTLKSRNLESLNWVAVGGDMVTSALVAIIEQCFPQAEYNTVHGMTECGGIFDWPYEQGIDSIPFYQGISPLGRLAPGARIRMVSPTGEVVARGEVGELHLQHESVFKGYLREQAETPELYTDESGQWFKTGDLAVVNEAGDVYLVGRQKDVIKRAAVSIAPAAIESCLQRFIGSQVSA